MKFYGMNYFKLCCKYILWFYEFSVTYQIYMNGWWLYCGWIHVLQCFSRSLRSKLASWIWCIYRTSLILCPGTSMWESSINLCKELDDSMQDSRLNRAWERFYYGHLGSKLTMGPKLNHSYTIGVELSWNSWCSWILLRNVAFDSMHCEFDKNVTTEYNRLTMCGKQTWRWLKAMHYYTHKEILLST